MPKTTQLSGETLEVSDYPRSPCAPTLVPCSLPYAQPLWASGIKEHRRFSAGWSFLIISLSPEGREGTCPVSPRLELGSLLPKPGSHPSSLVHSGNPHLPPLSPRLPMDFHYGSKLSSLGRKEWVTLGDLRVCVPFFLRKMGEVGGPRRGQE